MKRILIAVGMLALLSTPSFAGGIGAMFAYWDPSDASDDNGLGLKLEIDLSQQWSLDVRASFLDGHELVIPGQAFLIESTPIDLGVSYSFNRGARVNPYVGGGLSYVLFDSKTRGPVQTAGQNPPARIKDESGWYVVGGFEFEVAPRLAIFAEALYRQAKAEIQGDDLSFFTEADVDFAGGGANVGIAFTF